MLLFDAATLTVLFIYLATQISNRLEQWRLPVVLALAMILVCHLLVEGLRWQLVPMYVSLALAAICQQAPLPRRWVKGLAIFAAVIAPLSLLASWAFPMFKLPTPTGDYAVGTTKIDLLDESRRDVYPELPGSRRLTLRVWYPAQNSDTRRAPYWRHAKLRSEITLASTPLPGFTFTHLGKIPTHSVWNAKPAGNEPLPVVIYSHGIGLGWNSGNTVLAEALASSGYVVLAIGHAGIGSATIFSDATVATFDQATAAAMNQPPGEAVRQLQVRLRASEQWQEQVALYAEGMDLMDQNALTLVTYALNVMIADQQFVRRTLSEISARLNLELDVTQVGLMGMSLGGCAAMLNCADNRICQAGVNLDGFHPDQIGLGAQAPFLYLSSDGNLLSGANYHKTDTAYWALIPDTTHFNFFDFAIMSPLYRRMGVLGEIDGARGMAITSDYTIAFFERHLKGNGARFPDGYPRVEFLSR